jgi:outer membrane protein TolC
VVKLAHADEETAKARAKAGLPPETSSKVEERYYGLLVAQRQLARAEAKAREVENRQLVASSSSPPVSSSGKVDELVEAANAMAEANIQVQELTAALNQLLGWPLDTELELAVPAPPGETISLQEATDKALAANAQVVEAEQTLAKTRAASALSKLEYVPDFAVLGGYVYNGNTIPILPRDFSYIGIVGTYTLFDFGKREHSIKERKAQVEMAEIGVQLTKAKIAAGVKTSYLEMERSRQLSQLRHRLATAMGLSETASREQTRGLTASQAKAEAEMFEADLAYRQALTRLKALTGEQ